MPSLPKRLCAVPGCTELATGGRGRCKAHARAPVTDYRERTNAMYNTGRWKVKRRKQLDREPLCRECAKNGKISEAVEVDHIKPHKGDWALFWDDANLQSLCHKCHSRKTAGEMGAFGRLRW